MGIPCSPDCQQPHHIKQPLQIPEESITFKNIKQKIKSCLSLHDAISQRNTEPLLGLSPSLPGLSLRRPFERSCCHLVSPAQPRDPTAHCARGSGQPGRHTGHLWPSPRDTFCPNQRVWLLYKQPLHCILLHITQQVS